MVRTRAGADAAAAGAGDNLGADDIKCYPRGVAHQMLEKYQPRADANADRGEESRGPADARLPEDTQDPLGVFADKTGRTPFETLAKTGRPEKPWSGQERVVLWVRPTRTASAFPPRPPNSRNGQAPPRDACWMVKCSAAPYRDKETGLALDIEGRAVEWAARRSDLEWLDGTQVKWFAWAAEHPGLPPNTLSRQGLIPCLP